MLNMYDWNYPKNRSNRIMQLVRSENKSNDKIVFYAPHEKDLFQ